jgi:hypothetical protein
MKSIAGWVRTHRKALVGYAGLVLTGLSLAYPHDHWIAAAVAAATALGVHLVPNAEAR